MWSALACALALCACREEKRSWTSFTEATEQTSTSIADTASRAAPIVPNPPDTLAGAQPSRSGTLSISLAAHSAPPLNGRAMLKANGNSTIVSVHLQSTSGAAPYEGVVRVGRCAHLGPPATDLQPVSTDSLGKGASASFINIPLDTLRAKQHAVVYGSGGRPDTCGDIS
jgi:hypothetical protein